jgi:hypothetical protein
MRRGPQNSAEKRERSLTTVSTIVASAKAADNGSLRAILKAPAQFGLHSITLVAVDRKGITGMNFLVVHSDDQEPRR